MIQSKQVGVAELADAADSNSVAEKRAGSTPVSDMQSKLNILRDQINKLSLEMPKEVYMWKPNEAYGWGWSDACDTVINLIDDIDFFAKLKENE